MSAGYSSVSGGGIIKSSDSSGRDSFVMSLASIYSPKTSANSLLVIFSKIENYKPAIMSIAREEIFP